MTLKEQLLELRKQGVSSVKVGCKKGVSFFYADTLSPRTIKIIDNISKAYLEMMKSDLEYSKDYLANFEPIWKDRFKKANKIKSKKWRDNLIEKTKPELQEKKRIELEKKLEQLPELISKMKKIKAKQLVNIPKYIAKLEKEIPNFTSFIKRDVVECYDGVREWEEPNTKIILIKGNERANFWTIKEYRNRDTIYPTRKGDLKWNYKA